MSGIIEKTSLKEVIRKKHEQIKQVYLNDSRPWVIGYSGGKDSTTVVQLVFNALNELPKEKLTKTIYVISSDTYVENPLIIDYIEENLKKINSYASELKLPIVATKVLPKPKDSFWTLMIGKGYPSPRQYFRWCTNRLKINPANQFIIDKVNEFGEAIMVLGVRRSESASRASVMDNHKIDGKILRKHTSLNNAYVYAPIEDFTTSDVWAYLTAIDSPWGGNNGNLSNLYQSSSDESECPLVIDKTTPSCGNSRFGCWVCTVVVEDKSLNGFINSGTTWLLPLLKFRNYLYKIRNDENKRENKRMNGSIYYIKTDDGLKRGLGPFTMETRKEILDFLIKTQIDVNNFKKDFDARMGIKSSKEIKLIQDFELKQIRDLWLENGDWEDSLPTIYSKYYDVKIDFGYSERPLFSNDEINLLDEVAKSQDIAPELIKRLINTEISYYGYKSKVGILKKLDETLRQDWVHEEILEEVGAEKYDNK